MEWQNFFTNNVFWTKINIENSFDHTHWSVVEYVIMSPPYEMVRPIVFSSVVCLSVCPLVRPSVNCVRSISFEPLVGFTNNSAQMSSRIYDESMCSAYVWPRSVQGQGSRLTLLDCITCLLYNSSSVGDILKWLGTHVKYHKTMCRAHVWPRSHQGQCESIRSNTLSCPPYIF